MSVSVRRRRCLGKMLSALRRWAKGERHDPAIFDIVLYGSAAKGGAHPRDVDVAVIFRSGTLRERLAKLQQLKKKIAAPVLDLKGILWEELFHEQFFARSGILLEGISLLDGKPMAQKLGFEGAALFSYELKGKPHREKVAFNNVLRGRAGKGMIGRLGGERLAPGIVQVPIRSSREFGELLRLHRIPFRERKVMVGR